MFKSKKSLLSVAIVAATLGLTACGGSSSDSTPVPVVPVTPAPVVPVTPANSAPTDITLSANNVEENDLGENGAGAIVGTLSVTDADESDTVTYTVSDARFEIDGTSLKLKAGNTLDFEQDASVNLTITAVDSGNESFDKPLTIEVGDLLDYYGFISKAQTDVSSVAYSGQIARQILINDLSKFIGAELSKTSDFETNKSFTNREEVMSVLNSYFDIDDDNYDVASERPILTTTSPGSKQTTLAALSRSTKNLVDKIAGNDAKGQHKDWNNDFAGWGETGSTTPEELIRTLFGLIADNAETQMQGTVRQDPFNKDITNISLTSDGVDLKQLVQKFLLMSVAFSQGVDDYLDDDTANKGLQSDHINFGTEAYTPLEHQFDEAFGYFGAARDYLNYTDEEVAAKGGRPDYQLYHDTDKDGAIDFNSEYNFSQSTNAAKRDRGAEVPTDFSKTAMTAFLEGRKLLNDTAGIGLTDAERAKLYGHRDTIVQTWEKAIAATVIHYINDVRNDLAEIGTADFDYANTAKHWSEMKGFALGLQFNKASPLADEEFITVHGIMGKKPVLIGETEVAAYRADLLTARNLLQAAYEFNAENAANW